jgi:ABC-2 type transport system ATP-binding protein
MIIYRTNQATRKLRFFWGQKQPNIHSGDSRLKADSILRTAPDQQNLVIDLHNINLHLGMRHILRDLTLQLQRGELAVLYGANGAGKSTFLKLLAGLQSQAKVSGDGRVLGEVIWPRIAASRAQLGYMPQHGGLYEELSVRENVEFRLAMLDSKKIHASAEACANEHGLIQVWQQKLGQLSGGWKQRVAFAIALLAQPALLILDEPTAGVDLEAKAQIWSRIAQLKQNGMTILVSSHDADEARRADLLINLQDGHINYFGAPTQLCQHIKLCCVLLEIEVKSETNHILSILQQHPACLFIEQQTHATKIVWQDESSLQALCHQMSVKITPLAPELEDGLRAALRLAEKKNA